MGGGALLGGYMESPALGNAICQQAHHPDALSASTSGSGGGGEEGLRGRLERVGEGKLNGSWRAPEGEKEGGAGVNQRFTSVIAVNRCTAV